MKGLNKAIFANKKLIEKHKLNGLISKRPCVFINHKTDDSDYARSIADYLINAEIDVYFDKHVESSKKFNHKNIIESIHRGINESTHMLCVISPNSVQSKWANFVMGYSYNKIDIGVTILKGINESEMPVFNNNVKIIKGIQSINQYISQLSKKLERTLESNNLIKPFTVNEHPLDKFLERFK